MKLTFIRADHEVTGSCTLLEIGGHYGLIDCGMEQGRDLFENIAIPVPAAQIEFVLVTHAHMDHTGHLPLLYKQGFRGTVYATEATCDLCGIMLRDAAHIQMSEAEWKGRKAARAGQPAPEPLYTLEDVEGVLRLLRPCGYGKRIQVGESIIIRFTDVGHLLGSACIEAWLTEGDVEKKIVFSGDIGNVNQPLLRDPQTVSGADYVLIDCPAGIEQGFQNAVAGANRAVVVTMPEVSAVRDADRVIGILRAYDLPAPRLIINRIRAGMVRRGDMMSTSDMLEVLGCDLLGVIPDDETVIRAGNLGEPVARGNTQVSLAYRNIASRLMGEEVPFQELTSAEFFRKLLLKFG